MAKIRRMAAEFQNQFHDAIREAELADLKKDVDEMTEKARSYTNFNPLNDLEREIESAAGPLPPLDAPVTATPAATPAAPADTVPASTPAADAPPAPDTPPAPAVAEAAPAEPAAADTLVEPAKTTPDAGRAA
jgi:sec-independent protein translocase protein TatB